MKLGNKISVFVSAEDIAKSVKGNGCLCPISRAIQDKYNLEAKSVYVSPETVIFYGNKEYYYQLNLEAVKFICEYDAGKFVDPVIIEGHLVRKYER